MITHKARVTSVKRKSTSNIEKRSSMHVSFSSLNRRRDLYVSNYSIGDTLTHTRCMDFVYSHVTVFSQYHSPYQFDWFNAKTRNCENQLQIENKQSTLTSSHIVTTTQAIDREQNVIGDCNKLCCLFFFLCEIRKWSWYGIGLHNHFFLFEFRLLRSFQMIKQNRMD